MPYATSREWLENEISDKAEYIESEGYPVVAHTLRDALALLKEQKAEIDEISDEYLDLGKEMAKQPEIVRCKDCKHRGKWTSGDFSYVEFPDGSKCPGQSEDPFYSWRPDDDWFCAEGERS